MIPWEHVGSHLLQNVKCDHKNLLPIIDLLKKMRSNSFSWKQNRIIALDWLKKMRSNIFSSKQTLIIALDILQIWDPTCSHGSKYLLSHLTCRKKIWIWMIAPPPPRLFRIPLVCFGPLVACHRAMRGSIWSALEAPELLRAKS